MSDVFGLFAIVGCLYLCVRAVQTTSNNATILWLVSAALFNDAFGTVRQIAWLGALVLVPCAGLCVYRRSRVLWVSAALLAFSVLFVLLCMHWFNHQYYALREPLFFHYHRNQLTQLWALFVAALLLLLPILGAFVNVSRASSRLLLGAAAAGIAGAAVALFDPTGAFNAGLSAMVPYMQPAPRWVQAIVLGLAFACSFVCIVNIRRALKSNPADNLEAQQASRLPFRKLLLLIGPFTLATLFLVITRSSLWPRYLLLLLPSALVLLLQIYTTEQPRKRLPILSVVLVAAFAVLAVAETHDLFSGEAARVEAVNRVLATGVPRTKIKAGFELDGWKQIELTGYVNDVRIMQPKDAYHPPPPSPWPPACRGEYYGWTPSFLHPRIMVSNEPVSCFAASSIPPVRFHTWLAPHQRFIYVSDVPPAGPQSSRNSP